MIAGWILSLFVLLVSGEPDQQTPNTSQLTPSNIASPYWRKPGCYRVGHSRIISIPGCVKFNISTNACRGYCMSYSIPNFENLSPLGLEEPQQTLNLELLVNKSGQVDSQLIKRQLEGNPTVSRRELQPDGMQLPLLTLPRPDAAKIGHNGPHQLDHQQQQRHQQLQQQQASSTTEKRDVVSVSQCCNMMESEEVKVKLLCGVSEVRHLVFKSAKKCECFFCKHI